MSVPSTLAICTCTNNDSGPKAREVKWFYNVEFASLPQQPWFLKCLELFINCHLFDIFSALSTILLSYLIAAH